MSTDFAKSYLICQLDGKNKARKFIDKNTRIF